MQKLQSAQWRKLKSLCQDKVIERNYFMSDNDKNLKNETGSENSEISHKPYVNEKVKIYVIIAMIILALISAALVIFGTDKDTNEEDTEPDFKIELQL